MAKPVFLTPSAQEDLDKVLSYLSENWGNLFLKIF